MIKNYMMGIVLLALSITIILLLVVLYLQTLTEAFTELALIADGIIITVGLKLLFSPKKSKLEQSPMYQWTDLQLIQSAITKKGIPDLSHLTIRYSRRKDTADNPTFPYYIINTKTKKPIGFEQSFWS